MTADNDKLIFSLEICWNNAIEYGNNWLTMGIIANNILNNINYVDTGTATTFSKLSDKVVVKRNGIDTNTGAKADIMAFFKSKATALYIPDFTITAVNIDHSVQNWYNLIWFEAADQMGAIAQVNRDNYYVNSVNIKLHG